MRIWIGVLIIVISFCILFVRGLKNKNTTPMILSLGFLAVLSGLSIANIDSLKTLSGFGLKMETINKVKDDVYAKTEEVKSILKQVKKSEKRINKLIQYSLRIKDLSSKIVINTKTKSIQPEKYHALMGGALYLGLLQNDGQNNEHYLSSKGMGAITEYIDGKGNSRIEGDVVITPDNPLSNKSISFLENFNSFAIWISENKEGSMQNIKSISVSIIFFINQIEMGKIEADNLKFETIGEGDKSYKALVVRDQPVFINAEEKLLKIIESD